MLQEEFLEYHLLNSSDIPQYVWEKVTVVEDEESRYHRMYIVWHYIASMKMPDSTLHFPRLSRIALLVLTIPHSNAEEERHFSMVRKNKTTFCLSLDPQGTLSSIMTINLAQTEPAHKFEPPKELLKKAKAATWEYKKNILAVVRSKMCTIVIPILRLLCNLACVLWQHDFSLLQTYIIIKHNMNN